MLLLITIFLVSICFIKRKSKIILFITTGWLWILYGWSNSTADFSIYQNRYYLYESRSSYTEVLYTLLVKISNNIGLDFRFFLILSSLIAITLIAKTAYDLAENYNLVLGLYIIFPFVMDVTAIRYFLASSVIIWGFHYLVNNKDEQIKNSFKWCICVIIASGIHIACIFFSILVLAKFMSTKKIISIVVISIIVMSIVLNSTVLFKLVSLFSADKAAIVFASQVNTTRVRLNYLRVILILLEFIVANVLITKRQNQFLFIDNNKLKLKYGNKDISSLLIKCNILSLLVLPLITYVVDFYRILLTVSFLNYIYFTLFFFKYKKGIVNISQLIFNVLLIGFVIINLYFLVLKSDNVNTVFWPVFNNNILLFLN